MNGHTTKTTTTGGRGGPASGGYQTVTKTTTTTGSGQQPGSAGFQTVTKTTSLGGGSATIERVEVCHTFFSVTC